MGRTLELQRNPQRGQTTTPQHNQFARPRIPQGREQRERAPPKQSRGAPYQRQRRGGHTGNRQHGLRNPSVERRGPETFINNPGTITDLIDNFASADSKNCK